MPKSVTARRRQQIPPRGPAALRIMIVDDHPVVREGFSRCIESEAGMEVCCDCGAASDAFAQFCKARPDIVLVDLTLEEGSGLELLKDIVAHDPDAKLIVVSGHDEDLYAERCLNAGAMGYISKHEAANTIIDAIRMVQEGGIYLSQRMSTKLLRQATGRQALADTDPTKQLSDRELEVFELMGHGKSINEIADHLHLSPKTVETYRAHLKKKLRIETSQKLARRAFHWVETKV